MFSGAEGSTVLCRGLKNSEKDVDVHAIEVGEPRWVAGCVTHAVWLRGSICYRHVAALGPFLCYYLTLL